MNYKKILKWSILIIVTSVVVVIYKTTNPVDSIYFPKCPVRQLTGLECPGCGSQRAVHHLLNFDVFNAIKENLILVISIPYILIGIVFDSIKNPNKKILQYRKMLFGQKAIFVILFIIIVFCIYRNLF